jgi:photosystem II stability/assembly factor-like uncharacterized protein
MNLSKVRAAIAALALGLIATTHAEPNRWSEAGPDVATVFRVEFAAGSSTVAFARGGDKLWKSIDAGATWTVLQRNSTDDFVFALDRGDPNVLLLAGPGGAMLRSTDGGATFNPLWSISSLYALGFGTDGVAYASRSFAPRVMRSADHGLNWTAVSQANLPTNGTTTNIIPVPYDVAVDPTNSSRVYLGYRHQDYPGIYRSIDGGANWLSSTGLQGVSVNGIAIDPVTTSKLFVATSVGVYASTDSGTTWAKVPDPSGSGAASIDMSSVAIDPSQPQVIYAGGARRGEFFRSTDGGETWSRRDNGLFATTIKSIAPRPGASGDVLAGTTHTMFRTTDGGASWAASASGMKGANVGAIHSGTKLRVGYFDGGVYESSDGTAWTPLNNAGLRARIPTQQLSSVVGMSEGNRLFVLLAQDGVFASTDSGATWLAQPASFNPGNKYSDGAFITERGSGPVHYAGTTSGVFKTTNDGDTWVSATAGITMPVITALTKNTDGTQLFAGTFNGGMFKSTDGGMSWSPINNGLTNLEIKTLAYDNSGSNALIVGSNNGLFVTRDAGVSYTRLTDAMGPGAQPSIDGIVVEDFLRGSLYVAYQSRIFRSLDSGQTWTELSAGNPLTTFRHITGFASDGPGVLYAGATYTGLHQYTVSPDMQITAQAPPAGAFSIGAQFPWAAQVRNNGPHAATFSRLTWQLGANTTVISPTSSRGQCSVASQVLTCDFGIMQPGDTADVTMTVHGVSGGPIRIQASASSAELDLDSSNNTFTDSSVRIQEQVDLSATLTASASTVNSGETFDYVLTIRNDGPTLATGAEFVTTFDANDIYSLTAGSNAGCTGSAAGELRCPLPPLAAGQSTEYRWNVTAVPGGPRTASVIVSINADNSTESDTVDNAASTTLSVRAANDLSVQLTRSAIAVTRDNQFNYVMTVTNNGLIPSDNVRARLTLSGLVSYVSSSGATCSASGAVLTCDIGALAALASTTITVTVRALTAGVAAAAAEASGSTPDPHSNNNSANADVTVNDPVVAPPPAQPSPPSNSGGGGGGGGAIDYLLVLLGLMLAIARWTREKGVNSATTSLTSFEPEPTAENEPHRLGQRPAFDASGRSARRCIGFDGKARTVSLSQCLAH